MKKRTNNYGAAVEQDLTSNSTTSVPSVAAVKAAVGTNAGAVDESNLVHKTGNETIQGSKEFKDKILFHYKGGTTAGDGIVAVFSSEENGSPAPGENFYTIAINKSGVEAYFLGINKNSVTGQVPANSAFFSSYTQNGSLSFGRGNGTGNPDTCDLFINSQGYSGFGTTTPSEKLEVNGNAKAQKFIGDGSQLEYYDDANDYYITINASDGLHFNYLDGNHQALSNHTLYREGLEIGKDGGFVRLYSDDYTGQVNLTASVNGKLLVNGVEIGGANTSSPYPTSFAIINDEIVITISDKNTLKVEVDDIRDIIYSSYLDNSINSDKKAFPLPTQSRQIENHDNLIEALGYLQKQILTNAATASSVTIEQSLDSNSSTSVPSIAAVQSVVNDLQSTCDDLDTYNTQQDQVVNGIKLNITNNILPVIKKNIYASAVLTAGNTYTLANPSTFKLETGLAFFSGNRVRFGGYNGSVDGTISSYDATSGNCTMNFDTTGTLPAGGCFVTILPASFNLSGYSTATTTKALTKNDSIISAIGVLEYNDNLAKGFTTAAIKTAVTSSSATWSNGELQGAQPTGSVYGMRFTDKTYRYEYMCAASDTTNSTFVWIRTTKA